ncbi:MAG: AAA-like domain-containing protein [Nostoc sp.]
MVPRFKLQSMGLSKLEGDEVMPHCELYPQYFLNFSTNNP